MKSFKRIFTALLLVMLALSLMVFAAACGGNGDDPDNTPCTHVDANKNGECDKCGTDVEVVCDVHKDYDDNNVCDECGKLVKEPINYTITIQEEDGTPTAGVKITLKNYYEDIIVEQSTDAEGKITGKIVPGEYTIECSDLAVGWLVEGNFGKIELTEENPTVTLKSVDNNPTGAEDDPFFIGDNDFTAIFEPGETLYFFVKGEMLIEISAPGAVIEYNGTTYTTEDGPVVVHLEAPDSFYSSTNFNITNTLNTKSEITIVHTAEPGSVANPFDFTPDNEITVTITKDNDGVFYEWVADKAGKLELSSTTVKNFIYMSALGENDVVVTSDNTEGKVATEDAPYTIELEFEAGDTIRISVSYNFDQTDTADEVDVTFKTRYTPAA